METTKLIDLAALTNFAKSERSEPIYPSNKISLVVTIQKGTRNSGWTDREIIWSQHTFKKRLTSLTSSEGDQKIPFKVLHFFRQIRYHPLL